MTSVRRWDKQETNLLVVARWGTEQSGMLQPALRAVTARLSHARYHFLESKRLLVEHVEERLEKPEDIFWIMSPSEDEEIVRINNFFIQCEAHMLACAQAIHATADILAHVVYFSLGLNLGEDKRNDLEVKLGTVIGHLQIRATAASPSWQAVRQRLATLKNHAAFLDIGDVVNQAKHRGGPRATLALGPAEDKAYEMRFSNFFRGHHRPAKSIDDMLAPAFQAINEAVVDVGIALNDCLRHSTGV